MTPATLTEPRRSIPPGRWTVADWDALTEDGNRYELIEGACFVTSAPHWRHQLSAGKIYRRLDAWSEETRAGIALVAPGVIFGDDTAVIPDVVWVRRERLAAVLGEDGKLHAAPDLVIEVLSPGSENEARDRETKRLLYGAQGVAEYWILDRFTHQVEVYRPTELAGELTLVQVVTEQESLTSPLLPDFACPIALLFS